MMTGVFTQLLCGCCVRRRAHSVGEPDENTRLIRPDPEHELPTPTNYVVDQQILRDRLGSIVRAKEGKMVNVNTPLPFNLHNVNHDLADPSSSRSVTRSRSAHPVMGGGLADSSTDMLPDLPSRISSYSPTRDSDLSPSLPTSRSTSSLHPGDASYLPPDPDGGNRKPILNMRLVRGTGGYGVGGSFGPRNGRSVTRGRVGHYPDSNEPDIPEDGGAPAQEDAIPPAAQNGNGLSSREPLAETDATTPDADTGLPDGGKITCSWGD